MHVAVIRNQTAMVILLIQLQCDVNARDSAYNSPLGYAVKFNHVDMAILLIPNGADCFMLDRNNKNLFLLRKNIIMFRENIYIT